MSLSKQEKQAVTAAEWQESQTQKWRLRVQVPLWPLSPRGLSATYGCPNYAGVHQERLTVV